jgi:hypothetical protein
MVGKPTAITSAPIATKLPRQPRLPSNIPARIGITVAPMPLPTPAVTPSISPRRASNQLDTTLDSIAVLGIEPAIPTSANRI